MENNLIGELFAQELGVRPTHEVLLKCEENLSTKFYHFRGKTLSEMGAWAGIFFFRRENEEHGLDYLYIGQTDAFNTVELPSEVMSRLSQTQYELYIAIQNPKKTEKIRLESLEFLKKERHFILNQPNPNIKG